MLQPKVAPNASPCWCNSSNEQCPLTLTPKILHNFYEIEATIDEILCQYDEGTLKMYLKKEAGTSEHGKVVQNAGVHYMADLQGMFIRPSTKGKAANRKMLDGILEKISSSRPSTGKEIDKQMRPKTSGAIGIDKDSNKRLKMSQSTTFLPPLGNHTVNDNTFDEADKEVAEEVIAKFLDSIEGDNSMDNSEKVFSSVSTSLNVIDTFPKDSSVEMGLVRIIDVLARKILPWSACRCPQAVEALRDARASYVSKRHSEFISKMTTKLTEKVEQFLGSTDESVTKWIDEEMLQWKQTMSADDNISANFFKEEKLRISARIVQQEYAHQEREALVAIKIDDKEKDTTRDQLINFRKVCRSNTSNDDMRTLYSSIDSATNKVNAQQEVNIKALLHKHEEAHEWLCCIGDNALITSEAEEVVKRLYKLIETAQEKSINSLTESRKKYIRDNNSILDAISIFTSRIRAHASAYIRREQLISKAFLQYILGLLSGEIKPFSSETRKQSAIWDGKFASDRASAKEKMLIKQYNMAFLPFDQCIQDSKDKLYRQLGLIKSRMSSILKGRDTEINQRHKIISHRFSDHVKTNCTMRRTRLNAGVSTRGDEHALEGDTIKVLGDLCAALRTSVDKLWIKYHLRERRMMEASLGRIERIEKSAMVIWNKYSHLAIHVPRESYPWIDEYRLVRHRTTDIRLMEVVNKYNSFYHYFTNNELKSFVTKFQKRFLKKYNIKHNFLEEVILDCITYERFDTLAKNIDDSNAIIIASNNEVCKHIQTLRQHIIEFMNQEFVNNQESFERRRKEMVDQWQGELYLLNNEINHRVGSLKDMESDLEDSIRKTLIYDEVESTIFEQMTCSKLEDFWIEWKSRLAAINKEVRDSQRQIEAVKESGEMATSKLTDGQVPVSRKAVPDLVRLVEILSEVKGEIYIDLVTKIKKKLELIKKKAGVGRKRCIPAYYVTQTILQSTSWFWDQAGMSELCVGKLAHKGMLLFRDCLPANARVIFGIGSALTLLTMLQLDKSYNIDCEHIVSAVEGKGIKKCMLIGLHLITQQLGQYGGSMILKECLWACSCTGALPPAEEFEALLGEDLTKMRTDIHDPRHRVTNTSFLSADPVDFVNSILSIGKSAANVTKRNVDDSQSVMSADTKEETVAPISYEDTNLLKQFSLMKQVHIEDLFPLLINNSMPASDLVAIAGVLGRPNCMVETTPNRFMQCYYFWRKTCIAILECAFDPPSPEFSEINDIISSHVAITQRKQRLDARKDDDSVVSAGTKDTTKSKGTKSSIQSSNSEPKVASLSPLASAKYIIDWITTIQQLPISTLQSLSIIARAGACDPWLEDPSQNKRGVRIVYELKELLGCYYYREYGLSKDHEKGPQFAASFESDLKETIQAMNINRSDTTSLECLRNYLKRDDNNISNTQLSMVYWCICKNRSNSISSNNTNSIEELSVESIGNEVTSVDNLSRVSSPNRKKQTAAIVAYNRPRIDTPFDGNIHAYLTHFYDDVGAFLDAMPMLNVNSIVGTPDIPVPASQGRDIVKIAVGLDPSAKNPVPLTACVWTGEKITSIDEACDMVTTKPLHFYSEGDQIIHRAVSEARLAIEIDVLLKYPIVCVRRSDHMDDSHRKDSNSKDHMSHLLNMQINKVDKQVISWRNTMMDEWAMSLYSSRQKRYKHRAVIVKNAVDQYYEHYTVLKNEIVADRSSLINEFNILDMELRQILDDENNYLVYNLQFFDDVLACYNDKITEIYAKLRETVERFLRQCGSIKRQAMTRVAIGLDKVHKTMETQCAGLISSYQVSCTPLFEDLTERSKTLNIAINGMLNQYFINKEKFIFSRDEAERTVSLQVTDRLIQDRAKSKPLLDNLRLDTDKLLSLVEGIRKNIVAEQKEANRVLNLRIEKAVRESRKLRTAAENTPELIDLVTKEIRAILNSARTMCLGKVEETLESSAKALKTIYPLREPHVATLNEKINVVKDYWTDTKELLEPIIKSYQDQLYVELGKMKALSMELLHSFEDEQVLILNKEYNDKKKSLVLKFREFLINYNLNEGPIFDVYNAEIDQIVVDMKKLWGPSRPVYLDELIDFTKATADNFISSYQPNIFTQYQPVTMTSLKQYNNLVDSDNNSLHRLQIVDTIADTLYTISDTVKLLPDKYIAEKKRDIDHISSLSMADGGDWVRPQVSAIMDLLLCGVEMQATFTAGYDSLQEISSDKCLKASQELTKYVDNMKSETYEDSIKSAALAFTNRLLMRTEEINTLFDAADAHVRADISRMDVILKSLETNNSEWQALSVALIETSFDKAEESYLSNKWPTPPPTPRIEFVPETDNRESKLKALLNEVQSAPETVEEIVTEVQVEEEYHDPDHFVELQGGWLECWTADQKRYFFHPNTSESLWELPEALRRPLHEDKKKAIVPVHLLGDDYKPSAPSTALVQLGDVPALIKSISDIAMSFSHGAIEVALEITKVIKGKYVTLSVADSSIDSLDGSFDQILTSIGSNDVSYQHASLIENEKQLNAEKWLIMSKTDTDITEYNYGADRVRLEILEEIRFREEKENEFLGIEDDRCQLVEQLYNDQLKNEFIGLLVKYLRNKRVHDCDLLAVKALSKKLKAYILAEILGTHNTSFAALELQLFESTVVEEEEKRQVERLKSNEGRERHRYIMEHKDDIDEMSEWFREICGLSRITARKAGTNVVIHNIHTPKKLLKHFHRNTFDFKNLELDADDLDEVMMTLAAMPTPTPAVKPLHTHAEVKEAKKVAALESKSSSISTVKPVAVEEAQQPNVALSSSFTKKTAGPKRTVSFHENVSIMSSITDGGEVIGEASVDEEVSAYNIDIEQTPILNNSTSKNDTSEENEYIDKTYADIEPPVVIDAETQAKINQILEEEALISTEVSENASFVISGNNSSAHESITNIDVSNIDEALGISVDTVPNNDNNPPSDIELYYTEDGNPYYYSLKTGESFWKDPRLPSTDADTIIDGSLVVAETSEKVEEIATVQESVKVDDKDDIELAYTEDGNPYYYSLKTGESFWEDPRLVDTKVAEVATEEIQTVAVDNEEYDEDVIVITDELHKVYDEFNFDDKKNLSVADLDTLNLAGTGSIVAIAERETYWHGERILPVPILDTVIEYANSTGKDRQLSLLTTQDRLQNGYVQCQYFIVEQRGIFSKTCDELLMKATLRVQGRIAAFNEDVRNMQIKLQSDIKKLMDSEATLHKLMNDDEPNTIKAEKLAFVLDGLEKFRITLTTELQAAFKLMTKFLQDWDLISLELRQVGDIYDESIATNLEQCRMLCEHQIKLMKYDQSKVIQETLNSELPHIRQGLSTILQSDTIEAENQRANDRYYYYSQGQYYDEFRPEEEIVMSYLLRSLEMEHALKNDYMSLINATNMLSNDLQNDVIVFDQTEKNNIGTNGSKFDECRIIIEKKGHGLIQTLKNVRGEVTSRFQAITDRLKALEDEIEAQSEIEMHNLYGTSPSISSPSLSPHHLSPRSRGGSLSIDGDGQIDWQL